MVREATKLEKEIERLGRRILASKKSLRRAQIRASELTASLHPPIPIPENARFKGKR